MLKRSLQPLIGERTLKRFFGAGRLWTEWMQKEKSQNRIFNSQFGGTTWKYAAVGIFWGGEFDLRSSLPLSLWHTTYQLRLITLNSILLPLLQTSVSISYRTAEAIWHMLLLWSGKKSFKQLLKFWPLKL